MAASSDVQPFSRLPDSAATSATPNALLRFMMQPHSALVGDATLVLHPKAHFQTAPPGVGADRAQRPCHVGCSRGCTPNSRIGTRSPVVQRLGGSESRPSWRRRQHGEANDAGRESHSQRRVDAQCDAVLHPVHERILGRPFTRHTHPALPRQERPHTRGESGRRSVGLGCQRSLRVTDDRLVSRLRHTGARGRGYLVRSVLSLQGGCVGWFATSSLSGKHGELPCSMAPEERFAYWQHIPSGVQVQCSAWSRICCGIWSTRVVVTSTSSMTVPGGIDPSSWTWMVRSPT